MLSENILCHSTVVRGLPLCGVVDLNPYQLSCSGSLVGRARVECRGFESHLGQLFFPFSRKKSCPECS